MKKIKHKTKAYISLALYALMQKMPYEEISVKEICDRAGVSRMSFYRYYSNKDDIFVDYCDDRFEEFYNTMKDVENLSLRQFTLEMFKFVRKYARPIEVLFKANKDFLLLDQLSGYAKYVVSNLKSDFLITQKNNPTFPYFLAGGLFNVFVYWINNGTKYSPEEMNDMLYSIIPTSPKI